MLQRSTTLAFLLLFSIPALGGEPPPGPALSEVEGLSPLFNGKDLTGWWGLSTEDPRAWMALSPEELAKKKADSLADIQAHWRVEGDELVNDGEGLFLTTDKHYGDFELTLEYRTVSGADSGIYLRGCPQVQIWDPADESKFKHGGEKGSGGLWNNSPGAPGKDPLFCADKPMGEWNTLRIFMIGEYVCVWLNGQYVVQHARLENYFDKDRKLPIPITGPIQLQTHGGEIRWRNLFIREISAQESNAILLQESGKGFTPLFNHKDLTGWTGATESYTVADGAITCVEGKGGTLYTEAQFTDFIWQMEFMLPPGGNNGLAIRFPGEGDPAYDGMCEVQILDDGHEKYATIDPRQSHGSAYGLAPAQRGYLRPAGQWNHQLVKVEESRVTVELNGTRILDADLSLLKQFMNDAPHPGLQRTTGHIGFAGHGDPVRFRNLSVKNLD